MATRRSHKKSRGGCTACKARRVKCDEQGPPCGKCAARFSDCIYPARSSPHSDPQSHSPHPDRGQSSCDHSERHLLELELMHHWSTRTFRSFIDPLEANKDMKNWQDVAVTEALKHDFLMSGIFAVTALHSAHLKSGPVAHQYFLRALEYHDSASQSFRTALAELSEKNQSAIFAFSVINMGITLAFSQFSASGTSDSSFLDHVKAFLQMMKGALSIYNLLGNWPTADGFQLTQRQIKIDSEGTGLDSDIKIAFELLLKENEEIHGSKDLDPPKLQLRDSFRETIILLRSSIVPERPVRKHSVMLWTAELPAIFLQALDEDDPVALLTLMYWGALLNEFRQDQWWIGDAGRSLVSEVSFLLAPQKRDRTHLLLWPRSRVGLGTMSHSYSQRSTSSNVV